MNSDSPNESSESPPFCFLLPLQSEQVSRNWKRISKLFELSLASIFQQTSDNFRVYVACHEIPEVRFAGDDRLHFLSVDFPPPDKTADTTRRMQDKWDKLATLMVEMGKVGPSHIMIVDADDLVNRNIVEHAQSHPESNGWIIKHGFRYSAGSRWVLEHRTHFTCGTDSIINATKIVFPKTMEEEERHKCLPLIAGHTVIADKMAEHGMPLDKLPFAGTVYMVDHGDNDSHLGNTRRWKRLLQRSYWKYLKVISKNGHWRRLSKSIRYDFALPPPKEVRAICDAQ